MDIGEYRRRIDTIDSELLILLNRRAECAIAIGKIKKEKNLPVLNAEREKQVLDRITHQNPGPLPNAGLAKLFAQIMYVCKNLE